MTLDPSPFWLPPSHVNAQTTHPVPSARNDSLKMLAAKLSSDSSLGGVVILGHSEGSLIGMLASQRSPTLAFISIAGPGEKAATVLRRQLLGLLPPDLL